MRRAINHIISAGVVALSAVGIMLGSVCVLWSMPAPTNAADDGGPLVTRTLPHFGESCEEDMPCWDCSTMRNHICGVKP